MSDLNKLKDLANLESYISFWKTVAAGQVTPSKNEIDYTVWFLEGLAELKINYQQQDERLEAAEARVKKLEANQEANLQIKLNLHERLKAEEKRVAELDAYRFGWQKLVDRVDKAEDELARRDKEAGEPELDERITPKGLNRRTAELVRDFAKALAEKLLQSELKYGWSDGWMESDWKDKCLADFQHHATKGDPRDVAAYCAFMWHHGWSTAATPAALSPEVDDLSMQIRRLVHALKNSKPDHGLVKSVPDYMRRKGYWKVTDCLRGAEGIEVEE